MKLLFVFLFMTIGSFSSAEMLNLSCSGLWSGAREIQNVSSELVFNAQGASSTVQLQLKFINTNSIDLLSGMLVSYNHAFAGTLVSDKNSAVEVSGILNFVLGGASDSMGISGFKFQGGAITSIFKCTKSS